MRINSKNNFPAESPPSDIKCATPMSDTLDSLSDVPQKIGDLALRITDELLTPARASIEKHKSKYEAERSRELEIHKASESEGALRLKQSLSQENNRWQSYFLKLDQGNGDVDKELAVATKHIERQGISLGSVNLESNPEEGYIQSASDRMSLDDLIIRFESGVSYLKMLVGTELLTRQTMHGVQPLARYVITYVALLALVIAILWCAPLNNIARFGLSTTLSVATFMGCIRGIRGTRQDLTSVFREVLRIHRGISALAVVTRSAATSQYKVCLRALEAEHVDRSIQRRSDHSSRMAKIEEESQNRKTEAAAYYYNLEKTLRAEIEALHARCGFVSASWDDPVWRQWEPRRGAFFAARLGEFTLPPENLNGEFPDVDTVFSLDAFCPFMPQKAVIVKSNSSVRLLSVSMLQSLCARILASFPPGKAQFVFIDPTGRGASVGPLLDLQDIDLRLITGGICTEQPQISKVIEGITQHMDFVIQKYLRTNYASLQEYNEKAKDIEESYRFVVVFDFPTAFTQETAERLIAIARHGSRCGVFLVIMADPATKTPYGFNWASVEENCVIIEPAGADGAFRFVLPGYEKLLLQPDAPPSSEVMKGIIKKVGEQTASNMRVVIPFSKMREMALDVASNRWRDDGDSWNTPWRGALGKENGETASGIAVPLGQQGSRKLQWLEIGDESPHGIIIGSTGSGKSNLQHVIICSLALKYSPTELEMYLIDFKQGVEFKAYASARLPHARVIAIESEREFAYSVIEDLHKEMLRRGNDVFRPLGANSIADYRLKTGNVMPRILLLVDEYQGFFSVEDRMATDARRILEELVRAGRGYGIHILLASQSLTGMAQLPASILSQLELRMVLKCNENDARVMLEDKAGEAKHLTRKGETLYRAKTDAGLECERFQTCFLSEKDKSSILDEIATRYAAMTAKGMSKREPLVFEGNEMAHLDVNQPMRELMERESWAKSNESLHSLLGEPLAIRGRTPTACLQRQAGSNILVVGRNEREGVGTIVAALTSLLAQMNPSSTRILIADLTTVDTEWAEHAEFLRDNLPHDIRIVEKQRDLAFAVHDLVLEVRNRIKENGSHARTIFVIQGLQRAKALYEDAESYDSAPPSDGPVSFVPISKGKNASAHFIEILREGPEVGVHVIVWCDTKSALERIAPLRRLLQQFSVRVVTRMTDSDSNALIDDPAASKIDKDYRALFYDEAQAGRLPMFRPFSLPSRQWLADFCASVNAKTSKHI